jgi:hypothetical protein
MGAADFKINADVRRVLTKHWINLKILKYSCVGGTVYVRGDLDLLYSAPHRGVDGGGMTAEQVSNVERALKRISNVRRVKLQLNNWEKKADGWMRK